MPNLAQINVARLKAPIDDPLITEFADNLERINLLAEASPGFVWRLKTEEGDATGIRIFDDDLVLVNMSVWESLEDLKAFVYQSVHVEFLRRKKEWFDRFESSHMALWWVEAGHIPTEDEAREKLRLLDKVGESRNAFTFRKPFLPGSG